MKIFFTYSIVGLFAAAVAFNAAARDIKHDEALQLRQQGEIMPLEQLLTIITTRYPKARLLDVELEEDDGLYIYEVELITREGRVRELELDAREGRILQDEEDD
jgi:uncharacterized membrane protein YkoI